MTWSYLMEDEAHLLVCCVNKTILGTRLRCAVKVFDEQYHSVYTTPGRFRSRFPAYDHALQLVTEYPNFLFISRKPSFLLLGCQYFFPEPNSNEMAISTLAWCSVELRPKFVKIRHAIKCMNICAGIGTIDGETIGNNRLQSN